MKHKYRDDHHPAEAMFTQPFGVSWRKALVSLPRLVPDFVLNFTSEGPPPICFNIPSRGKHLIPVYVWVPSQKKHHHHHLKSRHSKKEKRNSAGSHLRESLRASTPEGSSDDDEPCKLPVLIDFHGGSFILGSCQEQAPFCSRICRDLNCVVISVDYRLGPYAQFPAANLDAEDVMLAVTDRNNSAYQPLRDGIMWDMLKQGHKPVELDDKKIAISGFSSGGNLALGLALSVRDDPTVGHDWVSPIPWTWEHDIPLLLFYPSLDARLLPDERPRPEGLDPPSGFVERWRIERELMPTYLPPEMRWHPRASPGLAPISSSSSISPSSLPEPATALPSLPPRKSPSPTSTSGPSLCSPTTNLTTFPRPSSSTSSASTSAGNYGLHPRSKVLLILPQFDSLNAQSRLWIQKMHDSHRGDDLEVEEVQGVGHGWTQFPDSWISEEHRRLKRLAFERAEGFLRGVWRLDACVSGGEDDKAGGINCIGESSGKAIECEDTEDGGKAKRAAEVAASKDLA